MSYQEFIFLACVNTWPDLGLPKNDVVHFAVSSTEGDPRGDVTKEQMEQQYEHALTMGWVEIRDEIMYITEKGRNAFQGLYGEFHVES